MDERTCSFPGCGKRLLSKGLCSGHYQQQHNGRDLTPLGAPKRTLEERFWEKVEKTGGCWHWRGAVGGHTYGNFWDGEKVSRAHTVSYELHSGGSVPEGMHIDHLCRVRLCVNPEHLEVVTPAVNRARGVRDSLSRYQNINQTECKRGHPLSGDNLYVQPKNGYRYCKTCRRVSRRRAAARQKPQGE